MEGLPEAVVRAVCAVSSHLRSLSFSHKPDYAMVAAELSAAADAVDDSVLPPQVPDYALPGPDDAEQRVGGDSTPSVALPATQGSGGIPLVTEPPARRPSALYDLRRVLLSCDAALESRGGRWSAPDEDMTDMLGPCLDSLDVCTTAPGHVTTCLQYLADKPVALQAAAEDVAARVRVLEEAEAAAAAKEAATAAEADAVLGRGDVGAAEALLARLGEWQEAWRAKRVAVSVDGAVLARLPRQAVDAWLDLATRCAHVCVVFCVTGIAV